MVNMMETDDTTLKDAQALVLKLGQQRTKLEDELKEWLLILEKNNVDMQMSLVDEEGFPRNDIDVYQVRQARQRIICIRNDLKKVMGDIESQLHVVHSLCRHAGFSNVERESSHDTAPIARISSVTANSPADQAGLRVNDQIVDFGSVNSENFNDLTDIANVVRHSVNELIKVVVRRGDSVVKLYLKPRTWAGSGFLGCVILPIEEVER